MAGKASKASSVLGTLFLCANADGLGGAGLSPPVLLSIWAEGILSELSHKGNPSRRGSRPSLSDYVPDAEELGEKYFRSC